MRRITFLYSHGCSAQYKVSTLDVRKVPPLSIIYLNRWELAGENSWCVLGYSGVC